MRSGATLSRVEARWLAVNTQGLGQARPRGPVAKRHVRSAIDAIGQVQLDAINVLERTQFLVLFSRLGPFSVDLLHDLSGPDGELFEYWGHAAALLPMAHHPLFRWRMEQEGPRGDSPTSARRRDAFRAEHADYIDQVFREVRDRGPLTAGELEDPRRRDGEWWDRRSFGRVTLEYLFARGELAGWRGRNFERVYDLPARVVPEHVPRATHAARRGGATPTPGAGGAVARRRDRERPRELLRDPIAGRASARRGARGGGRAAGGRGRGLARSRVRGARRRA